MATAGAKPKPSHLKVLNGRGAGKDSAGRKIKTPPRFVRKAPGPPTWMNREAKAEWRRVVPELERLQLVKQAMRGGLTAYCVTWSRFVQAQRALDEHGLVYEAKQGLIPRPEVAIVKGCTAELRQWCSEFGLTPTSEGRLSVPDELPEDGDDGFE